jgi:hypothetical protein
MEQGLAAQMVYGDGEGQNTKHYYAGVKKPARKKKNCNKKGKK